MKRLSDLMLTLLAVSCIGCATFHPSTNEQNARPDDFGVEYEWREGSLPPPYHYEYTVIIKPSSQSEIVLTPDYPSITVPKWTEFFKVEEQGMTCTGGWSKTGYSDENGGNWMRHRSAAAIRRWLSRGRGNELRLRITLSLSNRFRQR